MPSPREHCFTTVSIITRKSDLSDAWRQYDEDQCAQSPKKIRCVRCVPSVRCGLVCAYLKGPSRPGRFCIPFTDAKPAREMHMRRNLLHGDGRKNCGWRVDLRLDSVDIIKISPCGNYYRKSYRTLKLFIVHIKLRSYINCDIGTIFIILKSILIFLVYIF